ncbi:hypothetical protein ACO0KY_14725 [Undibacterium sp. Dicai25W]|uniref:hypothetical protein n=1 Tax=Undibacterium sp. Dicai25W TaxID=3413034 RepID=UPI003BF1120E
MTDDGDMNHAENSIANFIIIVQRYSWADSGRVVSAVIRHFWVCQLRKIKNRQKQIKIEYATISKQASFEKQLLVQFIVVFGKKRQICLIEGQNFIKNTLTFYLSACLCVHINFPARQTPVGKLTKIRMKKT